MAIVGELEGLISNHNLLISRGQIIEAAKVKELIAGYISRRDMLPRLYKAIRDKFEEFLYCAETNFERFNEIINYKHLTQLEFFYPEYFNEFARDLKQSAEKMISLGNYLYAGLLCASSIHTDRKILYNVVEYFLLQKNYADLERVFERLEETRQLKMSYKPQQSLTESFSLISDPEIAQNIGKLIFEAYSEETRKLETQLGGYTPAKNAYKLATILTLYLSDLGLITDSSLVSTATLYFKELARRADMDNLDELFEFLEKFKNNPATKRFAGENPEMFNSYMNSPDVRDVLGELMRNLLGKAKFDQAKRLDESLEGIISFTPIFKDHLASLKENRFFIQAIEMAEKLQLKEEITDELKLEAFRKLMDDLGKNPVKASVQRVKKFCTKYRINVQTYPQITEEVISKLEELEKQNPEIAWDLSQLYPILNLEKKEEESSTLAMGKLFEPIVIFFTWIFKMFVHLIKAFASRSPQPAPEKTGKSAKAVAGSGTG